jgi:hypothetical protein
LVGRGGTHVRGHNRAGLLNVEPLSRRSLHGGVGGHFSVAIEGGVARGVKRLVYLVFAALRVLHVDLVFERTGPKEGRAADRHAGAGARRALAQVATAWRVNLDPLPPTTADTCPALITAPRLVSNSIKNGVVEVQHGHVVLDVVHAGIHSETGSLFKHHLGGVPLEGVFPYIYVLRGLGLHRDVLGVSAARAESHDGAARRSGAA